MTEGVVEVKNCSSPALDDDDEVTIECVIKSLTEVEGKLVDSK